MATREPNGYKGAIFKEKRWNHFSGNSPPPPKKKQRKKHSINCYFWETEFLFFFKLLLSWQQRVSKEI